MGVMARQRNNKANSSVIARRTRDKAEYKRNIAKSIREASIDLGSVMVNTFKKANGGIELVRDNTPTTTTATNTNTTTAQAVTGTLVTHGLNITIAGSKEYRYFLSNVLRSSNDVINVTKLTAKLGKVKMVDGFVIYTAPIVNNNKLIDYVYMEANNGEGVTYKGKINKYSIYPPT
jgi:hypothetical protein